MKIPNRSGFVFQEKRQHEFGSIDLAGFHIGGTGCPERPLRVLKAFALIFVLGGSASVEDERGRRGNVKAGDLFFIPPGTGFRYEPHRNERWDEFWITFRGPLFDPWKESALMARPGTPIALKERSYWLDRLSAPIQPGEGAKPKHPLERATQLSVILGEILVYRENQNLMPADRRWTQLAIQLLTEEASLQMAALRLNLSYDAFRRRFTRLVGISPGKYQMRHIIQQASQTLVRERMTNKELAAKYGFSSEFHFSRQFKLVMGLSPKAYRECMPSHEEDL